MKISISDSFIMVLDRVKEKKHFKVERLIKDSGSKVLNMALGFIYLRMIIYMKVTFNREK
jgi:hypothetical protein